MNEFLIPANFEDSGKLLGLFAARNVIEAVVVSLPFIYFFFSFVPVDLTWKIILAAIFVVPAGGFALMGLCDDPLSIFIQNWYKWRKRRKILEYRGEIK